MRLRLTPRTVLVIRALRALEGSDRLTSAALAEAVGTTRSYVPQFMAPVLRAGWVVSGTGRKGGYELHADLRRLHLLDVLEVVEGPLDAATCLLSDVSCGDAAATCAVHGPWMVTRRAVVDLLARTSIAEPPDGPRWIHIDRPSVV